MDKLSIDTKFNLNGIIDQKLLVEHEECRRVMMDWIIDTREESLRNALIELGWTPPIKESKNGSQI